MGEANGHPLRDVLKLSNEILELVGNLCHSSNAYCDSRWPDTGHRGEAGAGN